MEEYYGKYRAVVEDVNDPDGRGRLLLSCPSLNESDELGWAESCLPPGVFILPKKGEAVYLEFEEGDINFPIWSGILPTEPYIKKNFFPDGYDPKKDIVLDFYKRIEALEKDLKIAQQDIVTLKREVEDLKKRI